jgi:hypothetical protein
MVPKEPPRRSRSNKEPVTIDLNAEETPAVAEPIRANDSDEIIPPPEKEAAALDAKGQPHGAVTASIGDAETTKPETPRLERPEPTKDALSTEGAKPDPGPKTVEAAKPEVTKPDQSPKPPAGSSFTLPPKQEIPQPADSLKPVEGDKPKDADKPAGDADKPKANATVPPFTSSQGRAHEPSAQAARSDARARQPARPATSTLLASGIFGGIVALLLAGSMQYAGYLPAASAPPAAQDNSELSAEVAALREQVNALANRPADGSAELANRVAALESSSAGRDTQDTEALTERLTALEAALGEARSAAQAATANNRDLAGRLEQAEAKINDQGPEQQAARAVAAAALKGAIDRGGAFEAELQTFANVSGDDPAIAQLQPFAAKGVPSRSDLQEQASQVADAMTTAINQPDPDQGIGSRLLSSAMSVVKVRRVGNVEGDTPDAVIARFEDRLRSSDLQAAAQQWEALPEPAKAAAQSFKQQLDARIQVENLVGGTLSRAIAGTEG